MRFGCFGPNFIFKLPLEEEVMDKDRIVGSSKQIKGAAPRKLPQCNRLGRRVFTQSFLPFQNKTSLKAVNFDQTLRSVLLKDDA
jgi:hypothetical protein